MNKKYNFRKGRMAENMAKDFLVSKGFVFLLSNYKNDIGEIDLIMSDDSWLVFVEVKYKSDDLMGAPEEMINIHKLRQVKRVAEGYLLENCKTIGSFYKYRIDAVCILGQKINHYTNIGK